MKKKFILFCLILIVNAGFLWSFEKDGQKDIVTIDFGMVERGIDWLEFINAGKDDEAVNLSPDFPFQKKTAERIIGYRGLKGMGISNYYSFVLLTSIFSSSISFLMGVGDRAWLG